MTKNKDPLARANNFLTVPVVLIILLIVIMGVTVFTIASIGEMPESLWSEVTTTRTCDFVEWQGDTAFRCNDGVGGIVGFFTEPSVVEK